MHVREAEARPAELLQGLLGDPAVEATGQVCGLHKRPAFRGIGVQENHQTKEDKEKMKLVYRSNDWICFTDRETFREEHYEVEAKINGRWEVLIHGSTSLEEATEFSSHIQEPTRIIRCTTVREVVD